MDLKQCDINTIREYRDKRIAHNDKKYFTDSTKLLDKYPFRFDLFEELIGFANETLCTIYSKLSGVSYTYNPTLLSGFDLYNLMNNLNIETVIKP